MAGDIVFQIIVFGLTALFVVSFSLFIRRLLVNSASKTNHHKEISEKLDRIIEIMEQDKK